MLSLYRRTGHRSPPSAPDAAREIDDRARVVDFRWRRHELQLAAAQETAFRQEACSGKTIDELAHVAETDASSLSAIAPLGPRLLTNFFASVETHLLRNYVYIGSEHGRSDMVAHVFSSPRCQIRGIALRSVLEARRVVVPCIQTPPSVSTTWRCCTAPRTATSRP
jgi:hypothetical protein